MYRTLLASCFVLALPVGAVPVVRRTAISVSHDGVPKVVVRKATEPPHSAQSHLSLQQVMTCPNSSPASKTQCMTAGMYDQIVNEFTTIMQDLKTNFPCTNDVCKLADFAGCTLRAAGHDFMDFRNDLGGSDGCLRFDDPDNKGLINCLRGDFDMNGDTDPDMFNKTLHDVYKNVCDEVSLADFIVIAGEAVMGFTATSGINLKQIFKDEFLYGRTTRETCPNAVALPNPFDGCAANEVTFLAPNAFGFTWRETAALMGVHTLGKATLENSGYSGWWQDEHNVARFNNNYYISIVAHGWGPAKKSSGKSQWDRIDSMHDQGQSHPEMMLNTDMCLVYKDVKAESSNCCAWERLGELTRLNIKENTSDDAHNAEIYCGFKNPFAASFNMERNWCCIGASAPAADCAPTAAPLDGMNGNNLVPVGPATHAVHDFAANEGLWLGEFASVWKTATGKGFSLHPLRETCPEHSYVGCVVPSGWERPFGNVAVSGAGAADCASKCKSVGYTFFGLECPMGNSVHCQCSNSVGGTPKSDSYCRGEGNPLVHAHNHCVGPYEKDGYLFGDFTVGSVYSTPVTQAPIHVEYTYVGCVVPSGWERPFGNVVLSGVGAADCASKCKSGGYTFFGLECPMGNSVHCQCSNNVGGTPKSDSYCRGEGNPLVHAHNHCVGAYERDGYLFGDFTVGSVYSTVVAQGNYVELTNLGSKSCEHWTSSGDGQINVGGPGTTSLAACKQACDDRADCRFFTWYEDNGCRTYTACNDPVDDVPHVVKHIYVKTASPTTASPTTSSPTTASPTTQAPTTASPTTASPTTASPTTASPTTQAPTTASPTTASPTTASPTTASPTTASPTTQAPTTASPTTASPTTASPTTASPTTASPTTRAPTTASPTTASPTTASPTTASPTTQAPTTASPTTASPTTASPTTQAPTNAPTNAPTSSLASQAWCKVGGDPHVQTFDANLRKKQSWHPFSAVGHWWLVRSETSKVSVQGYYGRCGKKSATKGWMRARSSVNGESMPRTCIMGVAVSGHFIDGPLGRSQTLAVKPPCDWDWDAESCTNATMVEDSPRIYWNGLRLQSGGGNPLQNVTPSINMIFQGNRRIRVILPDQIELDLFFGGRWGKEGGNTIMRVHVKMRQNVAGTQCGHCGDFDGDELDDLKYERWGVLKPAFSDHTGGLCDASVPCGSRLMPADGTCLENTPGSDIPLDCTGNDFNEADAICKQELAKVNLHDSDNNYKQALENCILDVCLLPNTTIAKEDAEDAAEDPTVPMEPCQVTLYEHWPEGITEIMAEESETLASYMKNWNGNFPTGATKILNGTGFFPLGDFRLTSSVKVQGNCCKATSYTDQGCTRSQTIMPVTSTTEADPALFLGVVAPARNLERYWGCNDCAQCVKVEQTC